VVQVNLFPTYCISLYITVTPTCSGHNVWPSSWSNVPPEDGRMLQPEHVGVIYMNYCNKRKPKATKGCSADDDE